MKSKIDKLVSIPVICTWNEVLFPNVVCSIICDQQTDIDTLQYCISHNKREIAIVSSGEEGLNDVNNNAVSDKNYHKIGCKAKIIQCILTTDGRYKVLLHVLHKICLSKFQWIKEESFLQVQEKPYISEKQYDAFALEDLTLKLKDNVAKYSNSSKKFNKSVLLQLESIASLEAVINVIMANLYIAKHQKQNFLEILDIVEQVAHLNSILEVDLSLLDIEASIRNRVKSQMEKNQKDYYLNEQIKAIQKEINNGEEVHDEIALLNKKLAQSKISKEGREKLEGEIKKLSMMNSMSAEASVVRNYIDWVLAVPWNNPKTINIDINKTEEYLEKDHYALNVIKERIIEYLAVLKKSKNLKSMIICLVGPPGVGKTSLAKSIATAANREFARISLGGVKDEAEIRGHRRTYIGAMPGKIIQAMKKVKYSNPLILLDEIDKMSSDYKGDPASALLEVLDPEQNVAFVDHYLEVEYDLSNVLFIATANSLEMHEALLDRMEVINLSGYSEEEKVEIAKRHIIPKAMKEASLSNKEFAISEEALLLMIRGYTKESGVRGLTRVIQRCIRKSIKHMLQTKEKSIYIDKNNYVTYCGHLKYVQNLKEQEDLVGVTNGLAWTRVGGDTLYIEAVKYPGKGNIKITGKIGDVMQESVQAAYSYIRQNKDYFTLQEKDFSDYDLHIHVPEGATPKDGPSAGVTMLTSIYSCLTGKKVKRNIAMTGEITLRGRVLPIGGVREKLLAAMRYGITDVIIPLENKKDLIDVPKEVLEHLNIISVSNVNEVINHAIVKDQ